MGSIYNSIFKIRNEYYNQQFIGEQQILRILITGAFGNIGKAVMETAYERGHEITVFEILNKNTRKYARKYRKKIRKTIFGDIRNFENVKEAIEGCDAVIHLAAIIPPVTKRLRELTMDINYGGTVNIVNAIKETKQKIPIIFTSSASVMGNTQQHEKLVSRNDPLVITGNYQESKIKCEEFLKENAENYLTFRLAGVLPILSSVKISLLEEAFDMHPDMRLEMILDVDVAFALVTGAEKLSTGVTQNKQAYILGGGKKNDWQFIGGEFLSSFFESFGLYLPDKKYFTKDINAYQLDWYDTKEVQQEFDYQNHSFDDYLIHLKKRYGVFKPFIILFRRIIMKKLVQMSPYFEKN